MRFVVLFLILGLARCAPPPSEAEAMLADACAYLWAMQADDGGWHSATHGLLRGGQAWTPFVLDALLNAPADQCKAPSGAPQQALDFIRRHLNEAGALGLSDPDVLEYPNYATAYALRVLAHHGAAEDAEHIRAMIGYLIDQQFAEHRGFGAEAAAYGSWGFGETNLPPGRAGHVDLSHTRRVVEALRHAGHEDEALYRRVEVFLRLVQKRLDDPRIQASDVDSLVYDGGFYASPVVLGVNKSAPITSGALGLFGSYATATCDGLLALLAAGATPDDARVQDAIRWLVTHPNLAFPEGIPQDQPGQWHKVLFYYHLGVRAEVYEALGGYAEERAALARALRGRQHDDGSFANPYGGPNKEDDPLLATALVVRVLSTALR